MMAIDRSRRTLSGAKAAVSIFVDAVQPYMNVLTKLIGPLLDAVYSSAGGPEQIEGYRGIVNKGPIDRLLPSELAYFDAIPHEFVRRFVSKELLFFDVDSTSDAPRGRFKIYFDCGPYQLGLPRIVQMAVLIRASERLLSDSAEFTWCCLQTPDNDRAWLGTSSVRDFLQLRTLQTMDSKSSQCIDNGSIVVGSVESRLALCPGDYWYLQVDEVLQEKSLRCTLLYNNKPLKSIVVDSPTREVQSLLLSDPTTADKDGIKGHIGKILGLPQSITAICQRRAQSIALLHSSGSLHIAGLIDILQQKRLKTKPVVSLQPIYGRIIAVSHDYSGKLLQRIEYDESGDRLVIVSSTNEVIKESRASWPELAQLSAGISVFYCSYKEQSYVLNIPSLGIIRVPFSHKEEAQIDRTTYHDVLLYDQSVVTCRSVSDGRWEVRHSTRASANYKHLVPSDAKWLRVYAVNDDLFTVAWLGSTRWRLCGPSLTDFSHPEPPLLDAAVMSNGRFISLVSRVDDHLSVLINGVEKCSFTFDDIVLNAVVDPSSMMVTVLLSRGNIAVLRIKTCQVIYKSG